MNKNDVLEILGQVKSDPIFQDFKIRRSDCSIINRTRDGYRRVSFNYYNSYDLKRQNLAMWIQVRYDVRFNVLHKWFEKYSYKELSIQRDTYSVAFTNGMLGGNDFFWFLENKNDYEHDLRLLISEVHQNAKSVFEKYLNLEDYYKYCVEDVIRGERELPDEGFDWVIEYLIATKIVAPNEYSMVKQMILKQVEYMKQRENPNILYYYDRLPEILADLENTKF